MDNALDMKLDSLNMFKVLKDFHLQIEDAVAVSNSFNLDNFNAGGITNIVVSGLGGSAIGGDYARSYLQYDLKIPMIVNRGYCLPEFCNENTLVIISSYSGNTEETVSALNEALEKKCRIICITTGGKIGETADKQNLPCIKVPEGYQPRCAIGYSFFIVLKTLSALRFITDRTDEIDAVVKLIKELSPVYSNPNSPNNTPMHIAKAVKGKLPVIYSSSDVLDTVNLRWRGQFSENSKILAYGNGYPEMNHNELVGWRLNKDIIKNIIVIYLRDEEDHKRVSLRMDITSKIIEEYANEVITLNGIGKSKLERIFELTYIGDWATFYLALLYGEDPNEIDVLHELKEELGRHI